MLKIPIEREPTVTIRRSPSASSAAFPTTNLRPATSGPHESGVGEQIDMVEIAGILAENPMQLFRYERLGQRGRLVEIPMGIVRRVEQLTAHPRALELVGGGVEPLVVLRLPPRLR